MATNKRVYATTPKGTLGFPCSLHEPDTKFADKTNANDKGNYVARLVLDKKSPDTKRLLEQISQVHEEYLREESAKLQKGKKLKVGDDSLPFTDELDEDGKPTGNVILKTKLKSRVVKKDGTFFDQRPKVFDAKGVLISKVPQIGPGSTVRLSVSFNLYNTAIGAGLSLRLEAVQLLDLIEKGSRDAKGYGFGEEDGFEADDSDESPFPAQSGAGDAGSGDY